MTNAAEPSTRRKIIWCDAGALPDWRGDGLQRVGDYSARSRRKRLHVFAAATGMDRAGTGGNVLADERGLPEVPPAACDFYGRFAYVGNVDFSFLFGPVACHASLVPAGATELATFGNCKAGFDFFSSMVFGDSPRAARFWSERSGAHTFTRPGNCFAHGGADSRRAGYGHRVHDFADRGGHAFCVRTFHALHRGGRACSDSSGVFINRPDALSIREIQSVPVAEF